MSIMKRAKYVGGAVAACLIAVPVLASNTGVTIQIPAASVVTSVDAADVAVVDAADYFANTQAEGVFAELYCEGWRTYADTASLPEDDIGGCDGTNRIALALVSTQTGGPLLYLCPTTAGSWTPLFVPLGAVTSSGLTLATGRLLGRTAAGTGAIQEITPDSTLSLVAGGLGVVDVACTGCIGSTEVAGLDAADLTSGTLDAARIPAVTSLASTCADDEVLGGTASGTGVECQAASGGGGIGGSVGSTDNAIPRADGTAGDTVQGGSLVTISDAGHMVFNGSWGFSGSDSNGMRLTTTSPDTPGRFLIQDRLGTTPFAYNDGYVYSPGGSALFLGSDIFGTGLTVTGFAVTAPSAGVPASASTMAFSVFADRVQIRSGSCLAWSTSATDSDASSAATGAQICLTPTDTPPSCGDASRGAIYFDDSLGEHCGCRGATGAASWQQLDGGGAC